MDRRAFLTTTWTLLSASPIVLWLGAGCSSPSSAEAAARVLAGPLAESPEAADLGRRILARGSSGLTLELLTAALTEGWPEAPGEEAGAASRLQRQHLDDFARGRTAEVDGWVLSLTEARLCALVALL